MGAKKKTIAIVARSPISLDESRRQRRRRTEVPALATPPARGKGRTVTAADGADGAAPIVDFLKERSC